MDLVYDRQLGYNVIIELLLLQILNFLTKINQLSKLNIFFLS
jgi:hypothetical protein